MLKKVLQNTSIEALENRLDDTIRKKKLRILNSFTEMLNDQVAYIARDKPAAARKFKSDILKRIREIPDMPFANRKSIFFDHEDIRDLIFSSLMLVEIKRAIS